MRDDVPPAAQLKHPDLHHYRAAVAGLLPDARVRLHHGETDERTPRDERRRAMTTWFTADLHLSHENIIKFCGRPFPDAATMDTRMITELQARVRPEDDLWILGDLAISKATGTQRAAVRAMFDANPGRKHLVVGNHDRSWIRELPWNSVAPMADIIVEGQRLFLGHYPMVTFPGARRGGLQLFGHVHQNWAGTRNSINVGVDLWEFRPTSVSEIQQRAAHLPVNKHWNEVEPDCPLSTEAGD